MFNFRNNVSIKSNTKYYYKKYYPKNIIVIYYISIDVKLNIICVI